MKPKTDKPHKNPMRLPDKRLKPQEPPGDVPSIAEEFRYMGVTNQSGENDGDWKKSDR